MLKIKTQQLLRAGVPSEVTLALHVTMGESSLQNQASAKLMANSSRFLQSLALQFQVERCQPQEMMSRQKPDIMCVRRVQTESLCNRSIKYMNGSSSLSAYLSSLSMRLGDSIYPLRQETPNAAASVQNVLHTRSVQEKLAAKGTPPQRMGFTTSNR